jgi:hypothetical protein
MNTSAQQAGASLILIGESKEKISRKAAKTQRRKDN